MQPQHGFPDWAFRDSVADEAEVRVERVGRRLRGRPLEALGPHGLGLGLARCRRGRGPRPACRACLRLHSVRALFVLRFVLSGYRLDLAVRVGRRARRVCLVDERPALRALQQGADCYVLSGGVHVDLLESAVAVYYVDAAHRGLRRAVPPPWLGPPRELPQQIAVPVVRLAERLLHQAAAVGGAPRAEYLLQVDVPSEGEVVAREARRRQPVLPELGPVGQSCPVDLLVE